MSGKQSPIPVQIELNLTSADQLFNTFDPSPFHERDLDAEAERYILGWAREASSIEELRLRVTLADTKAGHKQAAHIPDAIHNYFAYRALQGEQDLRELLRIGWRSLAIGLLVLILCYLAIRYIDRSAVQAPIRELTEQGLAILGWVANWRPLEIFLYDWWPIRRRIKLLRQLSAMPVEVIMSAAMPAA